jgi:tetratricopeptide (TPR) repeat protein
MVQAGTHLRWASDISPALADRERRLLIAALYLADEVQGAALRQAVEAAAPSPLRSYALGALVEADGQLAEAEKRYGQALAEARNDPGSQPLAASIAARLAGTYTLRGEGEKTMALGRWALDTGCLDQAAARQTRTRVAIGTSQAVGPREALAELGHLDADPARVDMIDVDGLSWRGLFRLVAGDLGEAVADMTASLKMVRRGATLALGQRIYGFLALAHYLAGDWDDALLTAGQGLTAAAIHPYRHELPLLHLAWVCVPAGRGVADEAERHPRLADEIATSLDYGQERLYAAMARALVCQASGDYLGMADALGYWRDDEAMDGRSRRDAALWRPLLAEGLIGSGQAEPAAAVLARLRADSGQVAYLQPALAWLEGWLAELQGSPEEAQRV